MNKHIELVKRWFADAVAAARWVKKYEELTK